MSVAVLVMCTLVLGVTAVWLCGCDYEHQDAEMTYHVDAESDVQIQYLADGQERTVVVQKSALPWTETMMVESDGGPVRYGMTVTALTEPYNIYVMVDVDGEIVSGGWWFAQQEVQHWMYWCPPGYGGCGTVNIGVEGGK